MAVRFKNDLGGLEALLEAAKFVELQDKLKNCNTSTSGRFEELPSSSQKNSPRCADVVEDDDSKLQNGCPVSPASTIPIYANCSSTSRLYAPSVAMRTSPSEMHFMGKAIARPTPLSLVTTDSRNGRSSSPPLNLLPHHIASFSSSDLTPVHVIPPQPAQQLLTPRTSARSFYQSSAPPSSLPLITQRAFSSTGVPEHAPPPPSHLHFSASANSAFLNVANPSSSLIAASSAEVRRKLGASGTREVHNKLEKNRRAHLKECFELLKGQVPSTQDEKKTSNLSILRSAIRYIQILKRREREYEYEVEKLAKERMSNQQKLSNLKKELQAQWDHIDFNALIPDPIEPIPTERRSFNTIDRHCFANDEKEYNGTLVEHDNKTGTISDTEESLSQPRSRADTLYSSSTSSMSSISPLNTQNSSYSDNASQQPQITDKSSSGDSPVNFTTNSVTHITVPEEPVALINHHNNDTKQSDYQAKLYHKVVPQKVSTNCALYAETAQRVSPTIPMNLPIEHSPKRVATSPIQLTQGKISPTTTTYEIADRPNVSLPYQHQSPKHVIVSTSAVPSHVSGKAITVPILKTANRPRVINGHQYLIRPSMAMALSTSSPTAFR